MRLNSNKKPCGIYNHEACDVLELREVMGLNPAWTVSSILLEMTMRPSQLNLNLSICKLLIEEGGGGGGG